VGSVDGEDYVIAPEYVDAARLSEETGLSLPRVYSDTRAAYTSSRQQRGGFRAQASGNSKT
jgi:pyridinium-3,5-bisthiocarboxylic acid mononucleotide nickel chelatase